MNSKPNNTIKVGDTVWGCRTTFGDIKPESTVVVKAGSKQLKLKDRLMAFRCVAMIDRDDHRLARSRREVLQKAAQWKEAGIKTALRKIEEDRALLQEINKMIEAEGDDVLSALRELSAEPSAGNDPEEEPVVLDAAATAILREVMDPASPKGKRVRHSPPLSPQGNQ